MLAAGRRPGRVHNEPRVSPPSRSPSPAAYETAPRMFSFCWRGDRSAIPRCRGAAPIAETTRRSMRAAPQADTPPLRPKAPGGGYQLARAYVPGGGSYAIETWFTSSWRKGRHRCRRPRRNPLPSTPSASYAQMPFTHFMMAAVAARADDTRLRKPAVRSTHGIEQSVASWMTRSASGPISPRSLCTFIIRIGTLLTSAMARRKHSRRPSSSRKRLQ
jgi:hypothetical protein